MSTEIPRSLPRRIVEAVHALVDADGPLRAELGTLRVVVDESELLESSLAWPALGIIPGRIAFDTSEGAPTLRTEIRLALVTAPDAEPLRRVDLLAHLLGVLWRERGVLRDPHGAELTQALERFDEFALFGRLSAGQRITPVSVAFHSLYSDARRTLE